MHNHVLFGLDDGCRTPEESKALARAAKAAGHRGFVATPHIRPGLFDNTPDIIRKRRDEARALVEAEGLSLHLGAEYYFSPELLEAAKNKSLLTLGESSRFVLTEFPQRALPHRFEDVLFEIRLQGYVPVIAHPERCEGITKNPLVTIEALRRGGALFQLDLGSLVGHYGWGVKRAATKLVKQGVYHIAAGDLHRPEDVAKILPKAVERLRSLLKRRNADAQVDALLVHNPQRILDNAPAESIVAV